MKNTRNANKEISIEIREIVFSNEEGKSFCDIFVYEPENIDEQALGNLYIIGEIVNLSENSSYLVNLLASIIKKEFYLNTKRTAVESLEASLHKANSTLSDLAEQGNVDWVGNLNMICAVYLENELHLSQTGNAKTLLIRNGQITDIGKNIIKEEKTHPFRTFANIASGELEIGDLVLFATPGFFNIFSLEKLRKLSSTLDFDKFAEKLQSSIEQEKNVDTAGSLIVKIKEGKREEDRMSYIEIEPITEEIYKEKAVHTLQGKFGDAGDTEKKIEKWAGEGVKEKENVDVFEKEEKVSISVSEPEKTADSRISGEGKKVSLENIIREYEEMEKEDNKAKEDTIVFEETKEEKISVDKTRMTGEKQREREEVGAESLIKESDSAEVKIKEEKSKKNILGKLPEVLSDTFSFARTKIIAPAVHYAKKATGKIKGDVSKEVLSENKTGLFQRLKLIFGKSKFLLIIFVVIAAMLAWNVISTDYQKRENDKFEKYSNILSQAENKINEVESIVIYGDFEMARELLADAKNSALEVKSEYNKLDDKADTLLRKIQVQFDRVDLVNRISDPKVAVDLSKTKGLKNAGGIIKIGKEYYIFDLSNNSLYQADFENNKADCIQTESGDNAGRFKLSTAMAKTGEIIFLTDSNKIAVFNINKEELNNRNIKFSSAAPNVKSIASYSSYLYLLEPDSNQIYKHTRLANGFGEGKIWIKDPETNIKDAVSLAIDGSIYVLKSDGSVDKYLRGSKIKSDDNSDFSIDKLGDPISNPTEIYTRSDLNYFYIIEPQKNRIVLFNKISGKLVRQYTSESFNNLKNIAIDDKEEKMYVLNEDKVFEVGIGE